MIPIKACVLKKCNFYVRCHAETTMVFQMSLEKVFTFCSNDDKKSQAGFIAPSYRGPNFNKNIHLKQAENLTYFCYPSSDAMFTLLNLTLLHWLELKNWIV